MGINARRQARRRQSFAQLASTGQSLKQLLVLNVRLALMVSKEVQRTSWIVKSVLQDEFASQKVKRMFPTQHSVLMVKSVLLVPVQKFKDHAQTGTIALLKPLKTVNLISDVRQASFANRVRERQVGQVISVHLATTVHQELVPTTTPQKTHQITQKDQEMLLLDVHKEQDLTRVIQKAHC